MQGGDPSAKDPVTRSGGLLEEDVFFPKRDLKASKYRFVTTGQRAQGVTASNPGKLGE